MNISEVRTKAKGMRVQVGKLSKSDLIRTIQTREGNFPCFETALDYCSQKACCWRDACLPSKKTMKGWERKRKVYTDKLAVELKGYKKQIIALEKKAEKILGSGKEEILDDIDKLKKKMAAIKGKSQKLSVASEDAWKITRKGLDVAWKDLSKTMKKAAKKFR